MRCITYGTFIVLFILLSFIIMCVSDMLGETGAMMGSCAISLLNLGLLIWWVNGFIDDCEDGYLLSNLEKKKSN